MIHKITSDPKTWPPLDTVVLLRRERAMPCIAKLEEQDNGKLLFVNDDWLDYQKPTAFVSWSPLPDAESEGAEGWTQPDSLAFFGDSSPSTVLVCDKPDQDFTQRVRITKVGPR